MVTALIVKTEYCEQKVPLLHFGDEEYLNGFSIDAVGGIALKQVMDVASRALLKEINTNPGLDKFVHEAKKFEETLKAKDPSTENTGLNMQCTEKA